MYILETYDHYRLIWYSVMPVVTPKTNDKTSPRSTWFFILWDDFSKVSEFLDFGIDMILVH